MKKKKKILNKITFHFNKQIFTTVHDMTKHNVLRKMYCPITNTN